MEFRGSREMDNGQADLVISCSDFPCSNPVISISNVLHSLKYSSPSRRDVEGGVQVHPNNPTS